MRLDERIWPQKAPVACASRRTVVIHLDKRLRGLHAFRVTVAGKRARVTRVAGNGVRVSLATRPKGRVHRRRARGHARRPARRDAPALPDVHEAPALRR